MADKFNSYDFSNTIRSLDDVFVQLVASYPTLIGQIAVGSPVSNHKAEWLNDSLAPTSSAIASFDTDGDGTGVNVASTAGFEAGSILRVTSSTGAPRTELIRVASVDSATDLTVVRDYGSTTGVTLVVGDVLTLVATPKNEGTDASASAGVEPTVDYNYTQIFDRTAKVSRSMQNIAEYGIADMLDYQVKAKMVEIMREMNAAAFYGVRVQRSSSAAGTMGGINQFITGGNVIATGGNLSADHINDALEEIFKDGGYSNNYAIVCSENQARRISALNTSGSNPIVMKQPDDRTFGGYISSFVGDLPVQSGFMAKIIVDPNCPKTSVYVLDMNQLEIAPLQNSALKDMDATPNGADYFARRIIGEYTLKIKNAQKAHALISGLNI